MYVAHEPLLLSKKPGREAGIARVLRVPKVIEMTSQGSKQLPGSRRGRGEHSDQQAGEIRTGPAHRKESGAAGEEEEEGVA